VTSLMVLIHVFPGAKGTEFLHLLVDHLISTSSPANRLSILCVCVCVCALVLGLFGFFLRQGLATHPMLASNLSSSCLSS
jgi:hypothetical protein